jgi:hypothetical protein
MESCSTDGVTVSTNAAYGISTDEVTVSTNAPYGVVVFTNAAYAVNAEEEHDE